jgi:hypothetical protein
MVRMFTLPDYRRGHTGTIREINLIGRHWNLRVVISRRPGFCLWRDHEPRLSAGYW